MLSKTGAYEYHSPFVMGHNFLYVVFWTFIFIYLYGFLTLDLGKDYLLLYFLGLFYYVFWVCMARFR